MTDTLSSIPSRADDADAKAAVKLFTFNRQKASELAKRANIFAYLAAIGLAGIPAATAAKTDARALVILAMVGILVVGGLIGMFLRLYYKEPVER